MRGFYLEGDPMPEDDDLNPHAVGVENKGQTHFVITVESHKAGDAYMEEILRDHQEIIQQAKHLYGSGSNVVLQEQTQKIVSVLRFEILR
jgi:hypothetical protein